MSIYQKYCREVLNDQGGLEKITLGERDFRF